MTRISDLLIAKLTTLGESIEELQHDTQQLIHDTQQQNSQWMDEEDLKEELRLAKLEGRVAYD